MTLTLFTLLLGVFATISLVTKIVIKHRESVFIHVEDQYTLREFAEKRGMVVFGSYGEISQILHDGFIDTKKTVYLYPNTNSILCQKRYEKQTKKKPQALAYIKVRNKRLYKLRYNKHMSRIEFKGKLKLKDCVMVQLRD